MLGLGPNDDVDTMNLNRAPEPIMLDAAAVINQEYYYERGERRLGKEDILKYRALL